jgi:hypothetical protein
MEGSDRDPGIGMSSPGSTAGGKGGVDRPRTGCEGENGSSMPNITQRHATPPSILMVTAASAATRATTTAVEQIDRGVDLVAQGSVECVSD